MVVPSRSVVQYPSGVDKRCPAPAAQDTLRMPRAMAMGTTLHPAASRPGREKVEKVGIAIMNENILHPELRNDEEANMDERRVRHGSLLIPPLSKPSLFFRRRQMLPLLLLALMLATEQIFV